MSLEPIFQRFQKRLDSCEHIFSQWVANAPIKPSAKDEMFLEGLLSSLWQHWSLYCRRIIFASAMGCKTRGGKVLTASINPVNWERASYISWRANSQGRVQQNLLNSDLKKEPTWGDVTKAQAVLQALSPQNEIYLSSCFGAVSRGPIHMQTVRNASAHRNYQSFQQVKNLSVYYVANPLSHPLGALLWEDPASKDYAFIAWVDELRILSDLISM